ncbi:Bug family tripartite tricarboxylate transporter substrate binding protein [Lampropedia aestuarii]
MDIRIWKTAALLCAIGLAPMAVSALQPADTWPTRSVRMLVGSAPGGGTDIMARIVADALGPVLKQAVVVENRPGASNTIAASTTAKASDGVTMVMGVVTAHAIAPHLLDLPYDSNADLIPVAYVGAVPNVLVVSNTLPVQSVADLVALAQTSRPTLNYASSGTGSTQQIAAEMFKDAAGIELTHVPYRGSSAAQIDLMSGQVQLSFDTLPSVLAQIQANKMRALAVTTATRNAQLPNVPTMAEAGYAQVNINAWYGLYMPASTPSAVVDKVHAAVNHILAQPSTQTRLLAIGAVIQPMSQTEFAQFHDAEFQRYGDIIAKNNIRIQ